MPRPSSSNLQKISTRVKKNIKRASEFDPNQNFLIYGPTGAGKTRLCATAPNVLLIDVDEKGTDSVRRDTDPFVIRCERWDEINDIYWYLQSGEHDFNSVAIDGISGLQQLAINFVLGDESARDASRDPDMPDRRMWGKVGQLMKVQLTNYRNLPMNVIYTALDRSREMGEGDEEEQMVVGPDVSPSVGKRATAAVGTIGYLVKREVVVRVPSRKNPERIVRRKEIRHRLLVGDSERYISKDRNGVFGEFIDAPNIAEMLEVIYGTNNKEV
jgi:hypothetical protein